MNMIPFHVKASVVNDDLSLVLDTQGRLNVGYFIESAASSKHKLYVSYDNINYHELKEIEIGQKGSAIGFEQIPWRYVKLEAEAQGNHTYELICK